MTLEELKAFELSHPEYKQLFRPMMTAFDQIAREEFARAFKAINDRLAVIQEEHIEKYQMSSEDAKVLSDAWTSFLMQADKDFRKNVKVFFEKNQE